MRGQPYLSYSFLAVGFIVLGIALLIRMAYPGIVVDVFAWYLVGLEPQQPFMLWVVAVTMTIIGYYSLAVSLLGLAAYYDEYWAGLAGAYMILSPLAVTLVLDPGITGLVVAIGIVLLAIGVGAVVSWYAGLPLLLLLVGYMPETALETIIPIPFGQAGAIIENTVMLLQSAQWIIMFYAGTAALVMARPPPQQQAPIQPAQPVQQPRQEQRARPTRSVVEHDTCAYRLSEFIRLLDREPEKIVKECLLNRNLYGYIVDRYLGKGSYGLVLRAYDRITGDRVAIKIMLPEAGGGQGASGSQAGARMSRSLIKSMMEVLETVEKEAATLRSLSSPYIVELKAVHIDLSKTKTAMKRNDLKVYLDAPPTIIMEYMGGGDLLRFINRASRIRSENRALWARISAAITAIVARALNDVHRQGYVHSDVKAANVLFTKDPLSYRNPRSLLEDLLKALEDPGKASTIPKLSDLGTAVRKGAPLAGITPLYAAPEILRYMQCLEQSRQNPAIVCQEVRADPSQDIYSLGLLLLQLLTGAGTDKLYSWRQIIESNPKLVENIIKGIPGYKKLADIIARMLDPNPAKRPSAAEVATILEDYSKTS